MFPKFSWTLLELHSLTCTGSRVAGGWALSLKVEVTSFCLVSLERKAVVTFHPAAPPAGQQRQVNKASLNKGRRAFGGVQGPLRALSLWHKASIDLVIRPFCFSDPVALPEFRCFAHKDFPKLSHKHRLLRRSGAGRVLQLAAANRIKSSKSQGVAAGGRRVDVTSVEEKNRWSGRASVEDGGSNAFECS